MYWLLLPVAAIALYLGLRTPSPALMSFWLLLVVACLVAWVWLRYRLLFPARPAVEITPLDPAELARLRQQTLANREAEAAARLAAEAEAAHPIHPVTPELRIASAAVPVAAPVAAPEPVPAARPLTGRAVFALPDDEPRPVVSGGDRAL